MTDQEKRDYLISKGWHTWYSPNYWVHTKLIVDSSRQDYTNYGLSLEDAYDFEINNKPPFNGQILGYFGGVRW